MLITTRFLGDIQTHDEGWVIADDLCPDNGVAIVTGVHDKRVHVFVISDAHDVHAGKLVATAMPVLLGEGGGMPDRAHGAGPTEFDALGGHEQLLDEANEFLSRVLRLEPLTEAELV